MNERARRWSDVALPIGWILGCILGWLPVNAADVRAQSQGQGVLTLEAQARRALAEGKPEVAIDAYGQLAAAEPQQAKWAVGLVESLVRAQRFRDALESLDGALPRFAADSPDHVELRVLTAKVNMLRAEHAGASGKIDSQVLFAYEEAAQIARDVVARHPDNRDANLILAEAEFSLGNGDAALAQAQATAARFPDHPGAHILIAKVQYQRFVTTRQRIQNEAPKGKDLERAANEAATARKATAAALEAAIAADPARAFPHKMLGDLHAWNDNAAQALASYRRALGLDPAVAVNHDWLANATKPDALIELYEKALAEYAARPDSDKKRAALLQWYLGKCLFQQKRFAPARETMLAAFRGNPEYGNSLYYVWLASYWLGNHDAAEREAADYARISVGSFADLLRGLPDRAQTLPILTFLAARAFKGGRLAESRLLNHVVAQVEQTAQAWNNYAFLCREAGAHADSLAAYERALELEPESAQLLNDAAVILQYHLLSPANMERAKEMYERAIRLAEQQLAGDKLSAAERERAQQAAKDARANLQKMAGG